MLNNYVHILPTYVTDGMFIYENCKLLLYPLFFTDYSVIFILFSYYNKTYRCTLIVNALFIVKTFSHIILSHCQRFQLKNHVSREL
jgi:hypothetical protein